MSEATLELSYKPEEFNNHGALTGVVASGQFAGEGGAFFNLAELRDIFLPALRGFPLSKENPPCLRGGIWNGGVGSSRIVQVNFGFRIEPFRNAGKLLVQIDLQSDLGDSFEPIYQAVRAHFWTEYAEIERFAAQFENLLEDPRAVAILRGRTDGFV
jgi:hypothetical protein